MLDRRVEERIARAVAGVLGGHVRRRDADDSHRPRRADDATRERVGGVLGLVTLRRGREVDEDAAGLGLDPVGGDAVLLVPGLAEAGRRVELVVVPGADDVAVDDGPVAERTAHVVADAGDRMELASCERDCDRRLAREDLRQGLLREVGRVADVLPVGGVRHGRLLGCRVRTGRPTALRTRTCGSHWARRSASHPVRRTGRRRNSPASPAASVRGQGRAPRRGRRS